ncbi:MAG TPA: hypothetical protein VEW68_02660 [Patescibacteria group bacterium]|nr:hypothetical protein [Patescibacteria group bacterium]
MGTGISLRRQVLPAAAASGAAVYMAVLLVLPIVDAARNVLTAHPEDYASGPYGLAVNLSYLALAAALASFTVAIWPVSGWAIAMPVLLIPAAVMCAALAVDPIGVAGGSALWLLPIFGLASAPLAGSLSLRGRFGRFSGALLAIAAAVLIAFVALMLAPESIGGAVNRTFDLLLGLWIAIAALALRRGSTRRPAASGRPTVVG